MLDNCPLHMLILCNGFLLLGILTGKCEQTCGHYDVLASGGELILR